MTLWVGVDVGGTFTDLVAVDSTGRVSTRKVLSTPHDQSIGVAEALASLAADSVDRFVHGTTVATNMLLERRGARVCLCVTKGFRDLLYLRRQNRLSLYNLVADYPEPLATSDMTIEVDERVEPQGITRALTEAEADRVAAEVAKLDPEVVAISLLHSYREPSHEVMLRDAISRRTPGVEIVISSDVFPEIREYERTATTVAEGYLRPGVARYLGRLGERLEPKPKTLGVMTSSGGMRTIDDASRSAAALALSGPAGGVVGAAAIARRMKIDLALTIDIGGTSADVGLIVDGEALVEPGGNVAEVPISMPRVLVETVSAGGGSIAWIDDAGGLRVGPRSAGAVPGPVAFSRGGSEPTVTDAHVALGRIESAHMSGGVQLDSDAARTAVTALATRLDTTMEKAAVAMIATADATMARALRRVSVERGIDPRDCTLIAFGGGGPLHACGLAELLGVSRIVVPPHAGVLSALGLAVTPERRETMRSVLLPLSRWSDNERRRSMRELETQCGRAFDRRGWIARMRYAGQGHEIDVPIDQRASRAAIAKRFHSLHERRFGFTLDREIEVVSLRFVGEGRGRSWRGETRAKGSIVRGPRAMALPDATLFVARGWVARGSEAQGWSLARARVKRR